MVSSCFTNRSVKGRQTALYENITLLYTLGAQTEQALAYPKLALSPKWGIN